MNAFMTFMVSNMGRLLRIVVGLTLIAWGLVSLGGTAGLVVALLGAVPLVAGLLNWCFIAPLFGEPIQGSKSRAAH